MGFGKTQESDYILCHLRMAGLIHDNKGIKYMHSIKQRLAVLSTKVRYFSASVFAGSIILNTLNNEAVTVNTIKMYGRTKNTDHHRESFGKFKNGVIKSSLPPPTKLFHANVWPTTLDVGDGKQLVIGTQVSNALVTSSTRLDKKRLVSIGTTLLNECTY